MEYSRKFIENKEYDKFIEFLYSNIDELENTAIQFSTKWITEQKKEELYPVIINSLKPEKKDSKIKIIQLFLDIKYSIEHICDSAKSLELFSKTEFEKSLSDIRYDILVGNNDLLKKTFFVYIILYYVQSFIRINIFLDDRKTKSILARHMSAVSVDYEFRRRQIALMQINFENVIDEGNKSRAYIWLINPGTFKERENKLFIDMIMINNNVYKYTHGPDSLDIPYMYEHMFGKNKEIMRKFMCKMYDTRYFCEYYKLNSGLDRSCSLYTSLLHFGTISQQKYDDLEKNRELMGPVQDINWDIEKLSSFHLKYAFYDVLFLNQHVKDLSITVSKNDSKNLYGYMYYNYFIRFIYMEQNKITDIIPYCKSIVDPLNNYHVIKNGNNYTLFKVFNNILVNLEINLGDKNKIIYYNFITHVRLISNNLNYIIKLVVYYLCYQLFEVYEKKGVRSKKTIDISVLYELLNSYDLKHIAGFVSGAQNTIKHIMLKEPERPFKV